MTDKILSNSKHSKDTKPSCTNCPYDKMRISYCGVFRDELPECPSEDEYILLKKGELFVYQKHHWHKVDTDEKYYFYDAVSRKLLYVDAKAKKVSLAKVEGKVLSCNGRKLYQARDAKLSKIMSLVDTESITRMTFIDDEQELEFTIEGKFYKLHEDSDFNTSDIEVSDDSIKVDTSDFEKGDAKVLIYYLRVPKCKGTGLIINHIIIRLGESTTPFTPQGCGPHLPVEQVSKGDFVVLQNEGSQEPKIRKISPTGTMVTKATITSNPTIRYYNTVSDTFGNVYHTGALTSGPASFGNIVIQAPGNGTFVFFVAKRSPNGVWLWVREVRAISTAILPSYAPTDLVIDESNDVYTTIPFGNTGYKIGDVTTTVNGVANTLILKYSSAGVLLWSKTAYVENGFCTPLRLATDSHHVLYIALLSQDNNSTIVSGVVNIPVAYQVAILKFNNADGSGPSKVGSYGPYADTLEYDVGAQLDSDTQGNLYIAGTFKGDTLNWEETNGTLSTPITGALSLVSNGFVAKVNSGYLNWINPIASLDPGTHVVVGGIALDNKGGLGVVFAGFSGKGFSKVVVGNTGFKGTNVLGVVKLTTSGVWSWSVKGTSVDRSIPSRISADTDGNFYITFQGVAAVLSNKITAQPGTSIAKVSGGNWIWAITINGYTELAYAYASAQSLLYCFISILNEIGDKIGMSSDIRQDPQKRLKGIVQENGNTQTKVSTYWYNGILSEKHSGLIPGRDYGIDVFGQLSYLTPLTHKREPNIKYIGTSCSTTTMILSK